jgi:hypothetical protein
MDKANLHYWLVTIPLWWLGNQWTVIKYNLPKWHVTEENSFWDERWFGRWTVTHDPKHTFFRKPIRRAFIDKHGEYRVIDRFWSSPGNAQESTS